MGNSGFQPHRSVTGRGLGLEGRPPPCEAGPVVRDGQARVEKDGGAGVAGKSDLVGREIGAVGWELER